MQTLEKSEWRMLNFPAEAEHASYLVPPLMVRGPKLEGTGIPSPASVDAAASGKSPEAPEPPVLSMCLLSLCVSLSLDFFFFLWLHLRHVEVSRPRVKLKLWLPVLVSFLIVRK